MADILSQINLVFRIFLIVVIGKFRGGCIRAYVDIQLPGEVDEDGIS